MFGGYGGGPRPDSVRERVKVDREGHVATEDGTQKSGQGQVIAMAGGGTGVHVYPALAMADATTARGSEWRRS